VLTAADLPLLRNGVILANAGHFPAEIDVLSVTTMSVGTSRNVSARFGDERG
jgi:S-adenosylhomocysteine hydrolase